MAPPRRLDSQHLADRSELFEHADSLDYPEYPSRTCTSQRVPAHGDILDSIPDPNTANCHGSNVEEYDEFAWMNHGLLPSLPSDQTNRFYSLYPDLSPSGSAPCLPRNPENRESTSTSLSQTPTQGQRGLPRRRSRYLIHETDQRANAIFIPPAAPPADPLERWRNSPPEVEPASLSAIQNALQDPSSYSAPDERPDISSPGVNDSFQYRPRASRAQSTTSGESATSASSRRSNRSGASNGSQAASDKVSSSVRKKQTGAGMKQRGSANNPRIFCCTFCCDKFKNKFDWMRHEKSLHLNLESWTCAPFGGSVVSPSTGRAHCAYCNQLDPTSEHLDAHNYRLCQQQQMRTFRRKDHLLQHLRLFHRLDTIPLMDDWQTVSMDFPSRCGFCSGRMSSWDERGDHLTFHFRRGCTMANWTGEHEFPPEIAAQVTHSVPPYLLDFESRTLVPFSATNGAVGDHLSQMLSRASFVGPTGESHVPAESPEVPPAQEGGGQLDCYTEVLTRHLSDYAQQMMGRGVIPTDEMFQREARRLMFDSEDQWNQTLADNLEWLAKFRGEQSSRGPVRSEEGPASHNYHQV